MRYCPEYCIEVPDDFPVEELTTFMAAARSVLLQPEKGPEWREFAGATNLIGWRYRASTEDWTIYKDCWLQNGPAVNHETLYRRQRALFGMFTSGVSCVESATYALAALASHPGVASIRFDSQRQRDCSPARLRNWIEGKPKAQNLVEQLSKLCTSEDWKLWIDLRNRMSHRSNLPTIVRGAVGGAPPPAKALEFAATSSTPPLAGDLDLFDTLHVWLASTLKSLLIAGTDLCGDGR
ncbi:hypothetical protein AZOA_07400 [Azoarcus sp. Aa7]|nr:hypothetical protein [Azoarcus sp. Aa7]